MPTFHFFLIFSLEKKMVKQKFINKKNHNSHTRSRFFFFFKKKQDDLSEVRICRPSLYGHLLIKIQPDSVMFLSPCGVTLLRVDAISKMLG